MEFKTTSTKRKRAFTLVEVLVSTALGSIVLAALMILTMYAARSLAALAVQARLESGNRLVIDKMSRKLRQATSVVSYSTNGIKVLYDGGKPLTYSYNSSNRAVTENDNGNSTTILKECDAFVLDIFKRNSITNTFNQFSAVGAVNEAKLIQLTWSCSDTLSFGKQAVESLASAKFVLRTK